MANILDSLFVLRFIRIITTPWEKMDAYKLGIIDKDGNFLKKVRDLKTPEEKDAVNKFQILAMNIKKLIQKVPLIGKSKLATYAAALWLLKEEVGNENEKVMLESEFWTFLKEEHIVDTDNLIESVSFCHLLTKGTYVINKTMLGVNLGNYPAGTKVVVTEDMKPVDDVLGCSVFLVVDEETQEKIPVTLFDLEKISC